MDQAKELLEMPREFVKDGRQFLTRCSKPDRREFLRISQAVGTGFLIMGVIGYIVKLSEFAPSRTPRLDRWYRGQESVASDTEEKGVDMTRQSRDVQEAWIEN
ncbi:hypothetical protein LTR95_019366 [Oleoguttula sp. CCFEE 5521]